MSGGAGASPAPAASLAGVGRVRPCRTVPLLSHADPRGSLTVAETGREVPFPIARAYWQHGVPAGASRGGHGHRRLEQVVVAVSGGCDFLLDDGARSCRHRLERPGEGLYIGPMVWREMTAFAPGTVILYLVSEPYDESEYHRSYEAFLRDARKAR